MSSLICTQFSKKDLGWEDILGLMKRCKPTSTCDPCTRIGYKIARSLIKIAALRIFADPEQSIIELPVNSLDAYNPSRKIGKFGMGSFSNLYWLIGHPLRKIIINSYSKDSEGKMCTYQATIQEINGIISFKLEMYPESEITTTGFRILTDASQDPFSSETVNNFQNQLEKLRFASGAKIRNGWTLLETISMIKGKKEARWWNIFDTHSLSTLNPDVLSENEIVCFVSPTFILTEDYATGASPEVLLGSMFVPSISTKTIQLSEAEVIAYENKSGVIASRLEKPIGVPNKLVILVGGIAVVSIESEQKYSEYYVIHMPYNTRLPVSRDDIILNPETAKLFKESITKIFEDLINFEESDVSDFQRLLVKYRDFTPSLESRDAVTHSLNDFYDKYKARLVPVEHKEMYFNINDKFIASENYDALEVERWLDANMNPMTNIWYGIKVLIVKGLKDIISVTNGGLISYLFISEKYKNSLGTRWIQAITTSYFDTKLFPFDSSYGEKEYEKYNKIYLNRVINLIKSTRAISREVVSARHIYDIIVAPDLGPSKSRKVVVSDIIEDQSILKYVFSVLAKFESLSIYFTFMYGQHVHSSTGDSATGDRGVQYLLMILTMCYIFLKKSSFVSILGELMKKFSSFTGSQIYGTGKNVLSFIDIELKDIVMYFTMDISHPEKKEPFFTDHVVCAIRAVKEQASTYMAIVTRNSPYNLIGSDPIGKEAWIQSSNITEFTFFMTGAGSAFLGRRENFPNLPGFVAFNLQNIRSRKYGAKDLVDVYSIWENKSHKIAGMTKVHLLKEREMAVEWIKDVLNTSAIRVVPRRHYLAPKGATKLRLGTMIRTLFEENMPSNTDLPRFLKQVSNTSEKSPLQIIEIAVNEGTVKPFIEATMTELVQNSIDVIREFNPDNKYIHIDLNKINRDSGTGSDLALTITDYVGMSSDAFMYVSIPFLSTKTPSELVTGEMGSGFFNAYRESSTVIIDSSKDDVRRISHDVPIRDDKGRVIDIEKSVKIGKANNFNITSISVVIPTTDTLDEVTMISRIQYMAKNVLGLSTHKDIMYSTTNIYVPRVLAAKLGYFELYYTDPDVSPKHESYLLTKGVPFSPLAPYFKHYLSQRVLDIIERNFIMNITHGGYTPVQTRTRINMPPEVTADFKRAATYTAFITMLREVSKGNRYYALNHMTSGADATQLRFTPYNVDDFQSVADEGSFLKYTSFFGQPTLASLINKCIDVMLNEQYKDKIAEVATVLVYTSPYPEVNAMVTSIITKWLDSKNKDHKPPPTERGKVKHKKGKEYIWVSPSEVPDEPDPDVEPFAQAYIQTYWKLAVESKIVGYVSRNYANITKYELHAELKNLGLLVSGSRQDKIERLRNAEMKRRAPQVKVVYSVKDQAKTGWYQVTDNTIVINTYNWNKDMRKEIFSVLKQRSVDAIETKLKHNKVWDEVFGYRFPAATMPHEMEHYRRHQSHEGSNHDSIYTSIFPGDEAKVRTYDQAANAVYQQVLSKGFYSEFLKAIPKS